MITDVTDHNFPAIYERLVRLFPERPWLRRVQLLQHQINESPMQGVILRRDNCIAYALSNWERLGLANSDPSLLDESLEAISFAAQVVELCESAALPEEGSRIFAGRVDGAFRNPPDMRALLFELHIAVHLHRQGCKIVWTDESRGHDTYDMLVKPNDRPAFELECKSFAIDKGHPVPHDLAAAFFSKLMPNLRQILTIRPQTLIVITLSLENGIPSSTAEQKGLAIQVCDAISNSACSVNGFCTLQVHQIELSGVLGEVALTPQLAASIADHHFGEAALFQVVTPLADECWVSVRLRSSTVSQIFSRLFKSVKQTAKRAIRNQLTGSRPGCLALRFEGATGSNLIAMSTERPNPCAMLATELMIDSKHMHLATVSFMSISELTRISETAKTSRGISYYFDNPGGNYPSLGIGQLFAL